MMGKNRKRRHDGEPEMELMYQENFVVVDIPGKGKGVRALTKIKKGTALFEYEGTVLTTEPDLEDDTYVFEVNHKGKKFWIDATLDVNCLGRYLNDETTKPNVRAVKKENLNNDIPTVVFYAIKDIDELDELTYNYGPGKYEWRKTGKKKNRVKVSEEVSEYCREMEGDETKEAFIKVIKKGTEEERFFKLSKLTHIGRSPDCDIVFNRQDIMPVQCKLHLMCNHVLLEDLSKKGPHRFSTLVNCSEFYVEDRLFTVTYMSQNTENNLTQKVIHEQESDSEMYDDSGESWVPPSESEVSDIEDMWIPKHENSDSDSDGDGNKTDIGLSLGEPRSETNDTGEETSGLNSISEIIPVIGNKIPKAMVVQQPFHKSKKSHCCFFCEKMFSRISRHYEQVHSNETDVARILALPKKSKERKHMWASLVNKGNFNHNYEVIKKGRGVIIAKYCPRKGVEKDTSMYLPCSLCLGIYSKNDLWRHQKTCTANCKRENIGSETKRLRGKPIQDGKLLLPPKGTEQFYEHILSKMRDDEVKKIVESDQLIMNFGEKLFEKVGTKVHQHQYVSQRLRELARLILEMREFKINDLETSLQPLNWEKLILGVRKVAGFDAGTDRYKIPTLCLKIGHSLQKCAKILKTKAIIQQDDEKKKCASSFLELYSSEWTTSISSKAHNTLHHLKFNKPSYLPLAEDVLRLNSYLNQKAHDLYSKEVNVKNYCDFAEVVLAQIVLFNRKRSGEVQRITVKDIEKSIQGKNFNVTSELKEALSPFERELCLTHDRVEIVGKRGSRVPILLTQSMKQYLIHLVENRNKVGVKDSQHLFIKPGSKYPIRGCDCLRRFAVECGAKYPGSLTSTKLRKHLATMTQILGLDEGNQDILAKFMGHDIRVHRNFYRLPEQTIELAKVSKVLHLINSGKIAKYRGMDFNDIVFNQDELCDEDDESETDDEENTNDSSHSSDVDNAHINRDDYSENAGALIHDALSKLYTNAKRNEIADQIRELLTDENAPEKVHLISQYLELMDTDVEAEHRYENEDWFEGLNKKYKTKNEVLRHNAQTRIRSYFNSAKEQIEKECDSETKEVLLELLDNLSNRLKKHDFHGGYFDRRAKAADRFCDNKGWFTCEGPFDSNACDKFHTINPYASKGYRQLFGLWNLDHVIEKSREVIPTLVQAAKSKKKHQKLNWEQVYKLLFLRDNLKLVQVGCHKKAARSQTCRVDDFLT